MRAGLGLVASRCSLPNSSNQRLRIDTLLTAAGGEVVPPAGAP